MRSHRLLLIFFLSAACAAFLLSPYAPARPNSAAAKHPVVIELFTSEGCSSCPPADSFLKKLAEQQPFPNLEIIALEEHVDYWNHGGWFDPFSSPEFTARQQDYVAHFSKAGGPYTPQMIIDGRVRLIGSHVDEALDDIRTAASQPLSSLQLALTGTPNNHTRSYNLTCSGGSTPPSSRLDLWIAVTEKGLHSNVNAGENAGHTLEHAPVVRYLHKQQSVTLPLSSPVSFTIKLDKKWTASNLTVVAFLSEPRSQQILAAGFSPL